MEFLYKTRGGVLPNHKTRVFFCATKQDYDLYFEEMAEDILSVIDCALYFIDYDHEEDYIRNPEEMLGILDQVQVVVTPVTRDLLYTDNYTKNVLIPAIIGKKPILPLMMEAEIDADFQNLFGQVQYMDKYGRNERAKGTQIPYIDKLRTTLNRILIPDQLIDDVKAAFKAHIFLSYRKQDRKEAQDLMKLIHSDPRCEQIAIWYDEFLVPGVDFNEAILEAIAACDIFFFNVTESFLQKKDNYIAQIEYPKAKDSGKKIIPVEMRKVDMEQLTEWFPQIDENFIPIDQHDKVCPVTYESLCALLSDQEMEDAKLSFFIGLAYLNGIDVEVNVDKGILILEKSANAGCIEAMQQLSNVYFLGIGGVTIDLDFAAMWQKKAVDTLFLDVSAFASDKIVTKEMEIKLKDSIEQICEAISRLVEIYNAQKNREGFNQLEEVIEQIGKILKDKLEESVTYESAWKAFMDLRIISLSWNQNKEEKAKNIYNEIEEIYDKKEVLDAKSYIDMLCNIAASSKELLKYADRAQTAWMIDQNNLAAIDSFDLGMRICELHNRETFAPYSLFNYIEGEKPVNRAFVMREICWMPIVDQLFSLCKRQNGDNSDWSNRMVYANYIAAHTIANIVCLNPDSIVDDALNEELQGYMDTFFDGIVGVFSSDITIEEKKRWVNRCLIMAGKMYNFELVFVPIKKCISNWEKRAIIAVNAAKQILEEVKTRDADIFYLITLIHVVEGAKSRKGIHASEFAKEAVDFAKSYYEKNHSMQAKKWLEKCEKMKSAIS